MQKLRLMIGTMKKRMLAEPEKKFLIVYVAAGHGMLAGGRQKMVINEFDRRSCFYKLWPIEAEIRTIAEYYPNSYQIAMFACCRELLSPMKHTGGYSSETRLYSIFVDGLLHRLEEARSELDAEAKKI